MTKYFKRKKFYSDEFGTQMKGDREGQQQPAAAERDSNKKGARTQGAQKKQSAPQSKLSEYGKQLKEKQRVRFTYGVAERQFRTLFRKVACQKGVTGENFLIAIERRLDNVVYRLKLGASRRQCRQLVVHGHVYVNGTRIASPSYLVNIGDRVSLREQSLKKEGFVAQVVEKRLNRGIKVPEWLILDKETRSGSVVRFPLRAEITTPVEEHLIVELYSK